MEKVLIMLIVLSIAIPVICTHNPHNHYTDSLDNMLKKYRSIYFYRNKLKNRIIRVHYSEIDRNVAVYDGFWSNVFAVMADQELWFKETDQRNRESK